MKRVRKRTAGFPTQVNKEVSFRQFKRQVGPRFDGRPWTDELLRNAWRLGLELRSRASEGGK